MTGDNLRRTGGIVLILACLFGASLHRAWPVQRFFLASGRTLPPPRPEAALRGFSLSLPPSIDGFAPPLAEESGKPEIKPRKNTVLAFLEGGTLLLYSQAKYWLKYGQYVEDWQYKLTWKDQKRRFFGLDAWRFDSNPFRLNHTHALAGGLYYEFARSNRFSWLESSLFALGESLWWEYAVEWREVISINDMIFTLLGGYACGEGWHQAGEALVGRPGLLPRLVSLFAPLPKINRWLDRKAAGSSPRKARPGPEFRLELGRKMAPLEEGRAAGLLYGGYSSWILDLPWPDQPGTVRRVLKDTFFSEFLLDVAARQGRWEEYNMTARAASFGWCLTRTEPGGRGRALFLGLGAEFNLFQKRPAAFYDSARVQVNEQALLHLEEPRNFRDKISSVRMINPLFGVLIFSPDWSLRVQAEASLDFAMVNALALNDYSAGRDISRMKTTLLFYGYYYGFGGTLSAWLDARWKGLRVEGRFACQAYDSIEGRDRFRELNPEDSEANDSRIKGTLLGSWRIPGTPCELRTSWEAVRRRGRIRDVVRREVETRSYLGLAVLF